MNIISEISVLPSQTQIESKTMEHISIYNFITFILVCQYSPF